MARQTPFPDETKEAASEPKGRHLVRSTYISSTANRSSSSGAEVTKSDAPNGQQCGLHDNGDNGVRNEFTGVQDAFETTCPVSLNIALAWLEIELGLGLGLGLGL